MADSHEREEQARRFDHRQPGVWAALRRVAVFLLLGGMMAPIGFVAAIWLSASSRNYLYREIAYEHLAQTVAGNTRDPETISLRILAFVHDNLIPAGGEVIDETSWNDLVRGIGWCDQAAWAMGTLLSKHGLHGRIVLLKPPEIPGNHAFLEVKIGEAWVALDPMTGMDFRDSRSGRLPSFEELAANPSFLQEHPRYLGLPPAWRTALDNLYLGVFVGSQDAIRLNDSILEAKEGLWPRWIVARGIHWGYELMGVSFAQLYQDLYLWIESQEPDEQGLYRRARGYELFSRTERAMDTYGRLALEYPATVEGRRALYFLGRLALKQGAVDQAISALQRFLSRGEDNESPFWLAAGHYYVASSLAARGDTDAAQSEFELALGMAGVFVVPPLLPGAHSLTTEPFTIEALSRQADPNP